MKAKDMLKSESSQTFSAPEHQSAGILDDFAVRKNVATKEGTIEKVPVNDSDIVNKKYVHDNFATEGFKQFDIKTSYGTIADVLARNPGWALCNGSNGTPDLRNKFIVCANADSGGVAKTTLTGSATQSGGSANHTHSVSGTSGSGYASISDSGHQHNVGSYSTSTEYAQPQSDEEVDNNKDNSTTHCASFGFNGHSHGIGGTSTDDYYANVYDSGHDHTFSATSGNNSLQPPYYALAYIMKL